MKPADSPVSAHCPTVATGGIDSTDPQALIGQVISERYEVEALLGVGGMGSVYRARHIHIRKHVALKTLHAAMLRSPEAVARFEREAVAAARLDHPNVVSATDFGRLSDGRYFLVMEYLEGRDLRQAIDDSAPMTVGNTLGVARQIVSALTAAHDQGIVHRDLKPDNVMLLQRGAEPSLVKVLDFGIAKVTMDDGTEPLTQMGAVFGTPQYMAPEQCKGAPVDGRTDLYALGIILFEMLTGRLPFSAPDALGYVMQHLTAEPAPLPASIPEPLRQVIQSLLEKDPERRPASAQALGRELEQIAAWLGPQVLAPVTALSFRLPARVGRAIAASIPHLMRPRTIGKATLPTAIWGLLFGGILAGLVLLWVNIPRDEQGVPGVGRVAAPLTYPSSAMPTMSNAGFVGEVERISQLKVYQRTELDWMILARGTASLARWEESVGAYQALLSLRSDLRKDKGLLQDLRDAAQNPKAFRVVLNLAETVLGKHGIDLIWELHQEERLVPDRKEQADKLGKKLVILAQQASPALRAAIELAFTTKCEKLRSTLSRAASDVDSRSSERLKTLQSKTGCGEAQNDDCFPCLRGSPLLDQAIAQAEKTKAPALGDTVEN